jgi:hypothetical protein
MQVVEFPLHDDEDTQGDTLGYLLAMRQKLDELIDAELRENHRDSSTWGPMPIQREVDY